MKQTALYIGADPLTNNDLDIICKSIHTFMFVNILLDRANRDAEYSHYMLNYDDRSDIIRHELKERKITEYRIIPVDETVQGVIRKNDISTLVLNFDYQHITNFKMMNIFKVIIPDVNLVLMSGKNFIDQKFMKTLIDSDSSMSVYKNYCSEYAFYKLKIKQTKKVCITSNSRFNTDFAMDIFRSRSYNVIDLDNMRLSSINDIIKIISKSLLGNYHNTLVMRYTAIPESSPINEIFDDIIFLGNPTGTIKYAHEIFTGTQQEITNQLIFHINRKARI